MVLAACSASPPEQDRSGPASASAAPLDYGALSVSIEKAITSGSVTLDTVEAVLVNADGQTVVADYRNGRKPAQSMHVFSVTKSVLSALVGIALDEKLIKDLDAPLADLLPTHKTEMASEMAGVTLRQLMTMTAGLPEDDIDSSSFAAAIRQDRGAVDAIVKPSSSTLRAPRSRTPTPPPIW